MKRSACWILVFVLVCVTTIQVTMISQSHGEVFVQGFSGKVYDICSKKPISGTQIRISCYEEGTASDQEGNYNLSAYPGTYEVLAEAQGYQSMSETHQSIKKDQIVKLDFAMIPTHPTSAQNQIIEKELVKQETLQPSDDSTDQGFSVSLAAAVPSTIRVLMPSGEIVTMDMDEYLKGVLPCEMSSGWPMESLRAQAVAARCYAATANNHPGANVCTTTHCQVWSPTHYADTDQAVASTHNVVATYGGSIIQAYYFGHCDGHTRNSEDVWGGYLPYCRSVSCPCGYTWLYGHGVGMCQRGAQAMANSGANFAQILTHYYTGVTIEGFNQDPIRVNQGMWIRVGPHFQSSYFDACYILKNYGSKAMRILPAICARGPNNENLDLGDVGWQTINPGQTFNVFKSCWLQTQGNFTVFAVYRDQAGNWHDINPGEPGTAHGVTINVEPISNYIKLSKGIWIHSDECGAGEYFDSLFEAKNYASNNPAYFEPYIWVRGPNNSNYDLGGINYVKLNPGQTVTCFKVKNNFGQILGNHTVGACAHIGYAPSWTQWHDLPPGASGTATKTSVIVASPNRGSQIVNQNIPESMESQEEKEIQITVRNTSTNVTWNQTNGYMLGIQSDWAGLTELELPTNNIVSPNQETIFTFKLKAPLQPGVYKISCQMERKNVAWFGQRLEKTINIPNPISRLKQKSTFYFAEGYTGPNFQEYLCIGNPNDSSATAEVTYMFTDGSTKQASYEMAGNSRTTVNVNNEVGPDKEVSVMVNSTTADLVVERPMYFCYQGKWTGGSDAVGATSPGKSFYFAEGTTISGFDEYITVLNPGNTTANLVFHYMVEDEGEKVVSGQTGAHSRVTFKTTDQIGTGKNCSLVVESDQPIVVERPMYFCYQGLASHNWTGGHDVVGTLSPAKVWYLAEGTTRDGFEEWLCLQNPNSSPITVSASYMLGQEQGGPVTKTYNIPPQQRLTVSVNRELGPEKDTSVTLTSSSDFIAERPMYFCYHGAWDGGHDVLGTNSAATTWFLAEGYTGQNFEEWLCLQNPGLAESNIEVTYYPKSGSPIVRYWTLPGNNRLTINVNQDAGPNLEIATRVQSEQPIIVERPIYFDYNGWTDGHDVIGHSVTK